MFLKKSFSQVAEWQSRGWLNAVTKAKNKKNKQMIANIIGWTLLIASIILPEKWFKTTKGWNKARAILAMTASFIFTCNLLNWVYSE
jgi:hypothetical protein